MDDRHKDWIKELHDLLRELEVGFEAEEATRIHLESLVLEVTGSESEGYRVIASVPLPVGGENPDYYIGAFSLASKLIAELGERAEYSLDTSLPDYPMLYATIVFANPNELIERLRRALTMLKFHNTSKG